MERTLGSVGVRPRVGVVALVAALGLLASFAPASPAFAAPGSATRSAVAPTTDANTSALAGGSARGTDDTDPGALAIVVDDAGDSVDVVPGDGSCADALGACTLRAAVMETDAHLSADTITFAPGLTTIVLSLPGPGEDASATGDLDVLDDLTIDGGGSVVVDGAGLDRDLEHHQGSLQLTGLTITGGALGDAGALGAGIAVRSGTASLTAVTVRGNSLTGAGSTGAGLEVVNGTVTVDGARFEDNVLGGDHANGAAIHQLAGTLDVRTTSIVDNRATDPTSDGAGLSVVGGVATIADSTIVGNQANRGVGLYRSGGTLAATSVTIADNVGSESVIAIAGLQLTASVIDAPGGACSGAVTSGGYNVVSDATCQFAASGDQLTTVAQLGPLGEQGGAGPVRAPSQRSTFVDAIPAGTAGICDGATPADQLGHARPGTVAGCTAGAVEEVVAMPVGLVVDDAADEPDAAPGDGWCATAGGTCTLRAAIDEADAYPTPDHISVAAGVDPVLTRSGRDDDINATGDLDVTGPVTIDGHGATLDAAGLDRALDVAVDPAAGDVTIDELHVTGGAGVASGAGVRVRTGALTLRRAHVHHNEAGAASGAAAGGGVAVEPTASGLTVAGATFEDNTATSTDASAQGGGLATEVPVTVTNSTFADNEAAGPDAAGGAFAITGGTADASIAASTITDNHATNGAGVANAGHQLALAATVLDNGADCATSGGSATITGSHVLEATDTCGLAAVDNLIGVDPQLGPLTDNGGPTPTRRPAAGSPVIDAVPAATPGLCDASTPTDQRGRPRPLGPGCDIGAVEAPAVPGVPTGVAAVAGDAQATVTWVAPTTDGDDPITSYVVIAAPGGATCTWTTGPLTCVVTGLDNGTATTFTVHAVNGVGPGPESDPSTAVTPATVPGSPNGVSAVAAKLSAVVSWAAPADDGGAPITGYTVTATPGGATCTWTAGPLTCTVTGLPAGTAVTFTARAVNRVGPGPASGASGPATPWDGAGYHPVTPTRILDSRGPVGGWNGRLQSGGPRALTVTGLGGDANVPASATAVVLNVTATNSTAGSFVTAYPTGTATPNASNLNFGAGQTIANLVTVKIGANGRVTFANAVGATDVIADVVGYYDDGSGPGDLFTGITPTRLLDSRGGTGGWNASLAAGAARDLVVRQPGNAAGVPATATAVIANITVTNSNVGSFVSVWPSGVAQPNVSNLNFATGQTIPNLAIVRIGDNGAIRFANFVGSVDVIVDVVGYFDPTSGSRFHAINPTRVLDSRVPTGLSGPWGPGITRVLGVAGGSGTNVPASATGLVANVTATAGTAGSFVTVFPDGVAVPNSSNVNFGAGETIPNLVTVKIGFGGRIALFNKLGSVHLIADAVGYYAPS